MTLFILYFIKVNVALAVLYLFYKLLFSKDTFFGLRRLMLILIYITAFTYPLLNFSNWIITDSGSVTGQVVSTLYKKVLPEITVFSNVATEPTVYSWAMMLLAGIYLTGVIFLLTRTLMEIWKTSITLHRSKKTEIDGIRVCLADAKQEPYSFFKWIYIHPDLSLIHI